MNKKLVVLAISAATFAPAALAQSANPVTMYGRILLMANSVSADGGTTPVSRRVTLNDGSSLLGFRGTEDLGGGLKAVFQLESATSPDTGGGTIGSRNSGVGLTGGFGTVMLGRWDSPFKLSAIYIDPTSQITLGNQLSVINASGFNRRENNTVQYWSPKMGGFSTRVMYGANEGRTATTNPSLTSFSIEYEAGGLRLNYANEKHKDQRGNTVTAGITERGQNLSGTFTLGAFKLGLLTQKFKSTGLTDRKAYQAALTYTSGKNRFFVTIGENKDGAVATALQPESKFSAVGYNHEFSKRSTLMFRYATLKNNGAANANLSGADLPTLTNNADPRGFGIGLRHTF
ncbi:MAG: porin [Betaproteobacteria bacterium]|nr:porin [Betaproteobacteria bacterium]